MLTDYLAHLTDAGRSPNTVAAYANDLATFAPTFGGLLAYVASLAAYKPASRSRKIASARSYCTWLETQDAAPPRWRGVLVPPTQDYRLPPTVGAIAITRLIDAPQGSGPAAQRDRAMLGVLADTGCRVSELVGLDVGDASLATSSVRLLSRRGEREVPLGWASASALAAYLADGRGSLALPGDQALFVNHRGARITRQGCWLLIRGHCRAAGLPPISPAGLRHAAAARLVAFASNIKDAQELLGHANIFTTQMYRARPARSAA